MNSAGGGNNDNGESLVWNGRPSQIANLPVYFFLIAAIGFGVFLVVQFQHLIPIEYFAYRFIWILPLVLFGFIKWLAIRTTSFELTNQRFKKSRGILLRRCDEMELYRVRDYSLKRPLHLLILGYGHITLETSDRSHATLLMPAIRKPKEVIEQLRQHVEGAKRIRGVRELDVGQ